MSLKNASEIQKTLVASGLTKEVVEPLVKGMIERKEVLDDLAGAADIDPKAFETILSDLKKSSDAAEPTAELLAKGGKEVVQLNDEGMIDVGSTLENIAEAVNKLTATISGVLAKGAQREKSLSNVALATGQVIQDLVKASNSQRAAISSLTGDVSTQLDGIAKGLKLPVAPRAVTGDLQPIKTPAEAAAAADLNKGPGKSNAAIDKLMEEMQKSSTSQQRKSVLYSAISRLENGIPVDVVAASYGLSI